MAIYSNVKRRMADERCVMQTSTIQPRIAGLATTYDKADMSSKPGCIRLQPSIIKEEQQELIRSKYHLYLL
jgi:hypothetical protein